MRRKNIKKYQKISKTSFPWVPVGRNSRKEEEEEEEEEEEASHETRSKASQFPHFFLLLILPLKKRVFFLNWQRKTPKKTSLLPTINVSIAKWKLSWNIYTHCIRIFARLALICRVSP